jgi:N-acetylglutamate synthase-like GNAT family acetyltransferase
MNIRKATINDIELLVKLRIDFLSEEFGNANSKDDIRAQLISYYQIHLQDNTFIAVIAEIDGSVVSTAYLAISDLPQVLNYQASKIGTLLNVLTYPQFHRRGIATKVLLRIIEEAKLANISAINLSATDDGRPLYEKLGFEISTHTAMTLKL